MFVVLYVKEGICYFEAPGVDKYTQVALVEVTSLAESKNTKNVADNTDDAETVNIDVDDVIDELE